MNIPAMLALALVLGGGVSWAREAMPTPETTQRKFWGTTRQENGIVVAVDAVTGKLRVRDMNGKVTALSAKKAKVTAAEGKILSLADISIGDEVSATCQGRKAIEVLRLHKAVKK